MNTIDNLRCRYKIGRFRKIVEITSTKDKIKYSYEFTVVTDRGEYKESDWLEKVEKQAKELIELDVVELLKQYCINELAWINTDKEAHSYALELYAARIWERKSWVGYEKFNSILNRPKTCEQISLI